jgi:hypothetical protein
MEEIVKDQNVIDFRYAPPSSWTNIGLKDDFYKTLVREDGALLYGFKSESFSGWQFKRVFEFGIRAAHNPQKVTQTTENSHFPCVVTTINYAKASLVLKAFAHLKDGRRTDIVLWEIRPHKNVPAYLTGFTVNIYDHERVFLARSAAPARVIFSVESKAKITFDFSVTASTYQEEDETLPGPGETAFVSVPDRLIVTSPSGFRPCSAFGTEPAVLHADEVKRGAIIVPQNYQDVAGLNLAWAEQAYREAKDSWERLPLFKLPFVIPDADVMAMLEACARNILQAREIKDGLPVFQVGPTCYRGLWVVDGHFLLEAGHYMGYHEDAYSGVDTLLKRVQPDGSITEFKFHTKETGISLLTLVRQCELMNDDQRLRELWPVIRNGVTYIEGLRKEAYALPEDSPCYKLLPMSFGDGGLGGWRGEYTTVFWILAGLLGVAKAARRLGLAEDAQRFQTDYDSLLEDFRTAAKRDMQMLPDGTPFLPMNMPGSGEHVWIPNYPAQVPDYLHLTPASATWAFCHAIYPGEVFDPEDSLVQNLLHLYDIVDDEEGVPAFTGWIPYQALWNYNASFAAHAWLYAGRGDKALDYLYAFANHASTTRVWREEQSFTDSEEGQLVGDMPHNWASAEFIRLVRHLVVFERGEDLELLAGVPAAWRKPGDVIRLDNTPTRFGPVSLCLETKEGGAFTLDVKLALAGTIKPETLKAKLPARAVTVQDKPSSPDSTGWTLLPVANQIHLEGTWLD